MADSVYDFVDDAEDSLTLNREYVKHSLAKDWHRIGHSAKVRPTKEMIKLSLKRDNGVKEVVLTYKQFVNQWRNVVKVRHPYLPVSQVNELTRQAWFKLKAKTGGHKTMADHRRTPRKSSLRAAARSGRSAKKVSFDLDRVGVDLSDDKEVPRRKSKGRSKSRAHISRYVKPLDISYESPVKTTNSKIGFEDLSIEINDILSDNRQELPIKTTKSAKLTTNCEKVKDNWDRNELKPKPKTQQKPTNRLDASEQTESVSPIINHLNSTRSLRNEKTVSGLSTKKPVLQNISNKRLINSKRRLFSSPVKAMLTSTPKLTPKKAPKVSVPMDPSGLQMSIIINESKGDVLCDMFDKDLSQLDIDPTPRSESLLK